MFTVGGACAFFGLLLAAIGLFGLLNYSIGRRTKEIGIRAALGAQRSEIVHLILKDVAGLLSGGLIVGLASALAFIAIFRSLLFGIQTADPFVIATAIGLFFGHRRFGHKPARSSGGHDRSGVCSRDE